MVPNQHYTLKGVKNVDGVLHIPLIEITTLCRLYPDMKSDDLYNLLTSAYKNLESNSELKKQIPVIETKKQSLIKKLFQRSTPDASSQEA